jgi:hypothetical protein
MVLTSAQEGTMPISRAGGLSSLRRSLARVYFVRGDTFDENVMAVWALE